MTCWRWPTPCAMRLHSRRKPSHRASGDTIPPLKLLQALKAYAGATCGSFGNLPDLHLAVGWKLHIFSATGASAPAREHEQMPKISPELLSVLRCPVTGSPLVQEGEELVATAAGDTGARNRYAIEDGIPLLLPPELLAAAASAGSDQHDPAAAGH
ncbi:uncharacterized protein YbaR (Trm112 family) [Arthrobacter sp. SLBN-122]|nr:uncharacterized protein YbaR (Trm112 family) [Arthrobacter sp. SLBN-122]